MLMTIYKYSVNYRSYGFGQFTITMPEGADILCVQMQNGLPYIWALVNINSPLKYRHFYWRATGDFVGNFKKYIGTIQDGSLVYHLFESEMP
jgi:hypothetical protein